MDEAFLDADAIRQATFIRHVEIHHTLDSSNSRGAQLARQADIELPALIVARHQTAGRGRDQHTWWSADGALTFSVVIEPAALGIGSANWPPLSPATAVAVCDALTTPLRSTSHDVERSLSIKWPNDVLINGRKVGGILIESPGGAAPAKDRLIIGIGINVNNSWREAPQSAGAHGIALCDLTETMHDLQAVLIATLNAMQQSIGQLATNDARLPADWQRLCCLTNQRVEVQTNSSVITGICKGIEHDGALLVDDDREIHRFHSGSVRQI